MTTVDATSHGIVLREHLRPQVNIAAQEVSGAKGGRVQLSRLTKDYDGFRAVDDVTIDIAPGEFVTVLGPSGSGKTTVLMMIAGLVEPSAGAITIGGRDVTHLRPQHRNLGVVFQSYALFPHLTAAENIAFPLRMRRKDEAEIRRRVEEVLDLVRLPNVAQRLPGQLSGGQQQRIALARALVFDPPVLLLDEPLSALDKKLRENMQFEIRELHRNLGGTVINVTHDQTEALVMSDRVIIMRDGRVVQSGSPSELYEHPKSSFVADFLGTSNFLKGELELEEAQGADEWSLVTAGGLRCRVPEPVQGSKGRAHLMLRPERIVLNDSAATEERFEGRVAQIAYTGNIIRYRVALNDRDVIEVTLQNKPGHVPQVDIGSQVTVGWSLEDVHIFLESTIKQCVTRKKR
ncbi:putative spermidine/putrescine transport system ATP-binding protein [Bradyrhizobium macuxiense]|uniref:Spermidine/putrescine import ATP-binding protein PotA n=1 Tax=Bradyrhizobium macuxiense TaxID=1755647 RepID=A0A560KRX0_9BRAD|nr:ABC transporter ATP-binding protein [Bradyrhizobium macuxiense]TWB86011.1 putative spermidine/putrescine transport system ATP-binding protein [Bradyrhizobium macuxiense]